MNSQVDPAVLEAINCEGNNETHRLEADTEAAIRSLKNNKTRGSDGILPGVLKNGKRGMGKVFCNALHFIWRKSKVPEDWPHSVIVPLFKTDCDNYRGIRPIILSKVFCRVMLSQTKRGAEGIFSESQASFRPGHSTMDQILGFFCQILERESSAKPVLPVFDFNDAFVSTNREALWKVLKQHGFSSKLI